MEMFELSVKRSDFNYAKKVYEEIILTQVLNQKKIIKAYKGLYGMPDEELVNVKQARMYLFALFNNNTNLNSLNIIEDVDPDGVYNNDSDALLIQIHEYQDELDFNNNLNVNEIRSLKMRINHLNKKLKEKEDDNKKE